METEIQNPNLNLLIEYIQRTTDSQKITAVNILIICLSGMQFIENDLPKMPGKEKKELLLQAMRIVMERSGSDAGLLDVLPSFIDSSIDLERGKITISLDANEASACCLKFCVSTQNKKK